MPPAAPAAATAEARELDPFPSRAAEPRRLAINFLFLSGGEFTAKLLTFAVFSYLARALGPANYGFLEFTLAVMVFFTLPVDMGLSVYGTREIARHPSHAPRLLQEITGLRMALALCSMLALAVFIVFLHKSAELKTLLAFYGISLLGAPFLQQWFFQGHDQMHWVGAASVVRQFLFAGLVFLTWHRGVPIVRLGLIEIVSVAGTAAFCSWVVRGRMGFAWPRPDMRLIHLLGHIRKAAPIGLSELAWAFMWYFCTVLLGFFFSDKSLGWFGASHRALMALNTFVWLYFFNLLPSISRCVDRPAKSLLELMDGSVRFAAWSGLLAAALLTALAPDLLSLIYGHDFRSAAGSFTILVWMLPIAMLSGHYRYILVAYNHQRWLLICTAISAAAAIALGFALEPFYGGPGAAYALLTANCLNFALVYLAVRKYVVPVPLGRQLKAPLTALTVSAATGFVLWKWNIWLALAGGVAVYATGLALSDGPKLGAFFMTIFRKPIVAQPAR
ncbi:MAG: oligosaccharide flippase family protein [Acidobacteriota bacterium]|nr:oligosaccharide flippase family protein [Acidobacteriota bacterium]